VLAVEKACEVLKAKGAKRALPLSVSAPFHSSLMRPAAERLKESAWPTRASFGRRQIPLINNIDVAVQTDVGKPSAMPCYRQAFGPVRWVEVVQAIKALAASSTSSSAGPARCWPAWSSASTPNCHRVPVFDPASLAEAKGWDWLS
jgi:[acyl-carrier-protein] S-malonyltransferase